jgi:hypothetical protein
MDIDKIPSIYNKDEQMEFCKRFDNKIYSEWVENVKPDLEKQIKIKAAELEEETKKFRKV